MHVESDDDDLLAPEDLYGYIQKGAAEVISPIDDGHCADHAARRSGRARKSVSYAAPPLDPFEDKAMFAEAERERKAGQMSAPRGTKRKLFTMEGLLADKRKQEKRKLTQALVEEMELKMEASDAIALEKFKVPDENHMPGLADSAVKEVPNRQPPDF
ncbi:hypothetical protein HKX48_007902 [Thoreauomyces humboldtii]|nr:hypothetical protein HKX48_007902 [Thoreauomyces humboldtii]